MEQPAPGAKPPHSEISAENFHRGEQHQDTRSASHLNINHSHFLLPASNPFFRPLSFLPSLIPAEQDIAEQSYLHSMAPGRRHDGTARRPESRLPVVDLTDEDIMETEPLSSHQPGRLGNARRGPRFANAIIDVEDEEDNEHDDSGITFVSSNRLLPRVSGNRTPAPQTRLLSTANPTSLDQDGFEITGSNNLQQFDFGVNNVDELTFGSLHGSLQNALPGVTHTIHTLMNNISNFLSPSMDYTQVAFDFIDPDRQSTASPPPQVPYQAPSPAPQGFTRSPKDDEPYVCPNCDDVLFEGEDEVKRQVWVVRSCGHVYCGECTQNRFVTKAKKSRKPNAKTFKTCVVDGCNSKTSASKAMTQLFI